MLWQSKVDNPSIIQANRNYDTGRKFGQQLKHADAIGADYAVIVGAQEVAAGMVTLRDMRTGEQEMLDMNIWLKRIRNRAQLKVWWKVLGLKLLGHYRYYGMLPLLWNERQLPNA